MYKSTCLYIVIFIIICILRLTFLKGEMHLYLWSFLIVPAVITIGFFPRWRAVVLNGFIILFIELITELFDPKYIQNQSASQWGLPLISSVLTNLIIFFIFAYVKIKTYKNMQYLQKQAIIDSLMGIYNRRYFNSYMERILPVIRETKEMLLLLSIDIDYFKNINDTYGHICGDEVLLEMSNIIKANMRKHDKIFRMGGEEVVVLLPNTDLKDGKLAAERLRETIEHAQFNYQGNRVFVTVSIGVAQYNGETVKGFMEKADCALYQAKKNGRNQVIVHNIDREDMVTCD